MNLQNKKRITDLESVLMVLEGGLVGRDSWGVWDGPVYTALFKIG